MAACLSCLRGWHGTCANTRGGECDCKHASVSTEPNVKESTSVEFKQREEPQTVSGNGRGAEGSDENVQGNTSAESDELAEGDGKRVRRLKRDAALKDQQSTGRKRAARMYPLNRGADCEWAGKFGVGGGSKPIAGCGTSGRPPVGKQSARHHGPDKNTLNNEVGNVHRICHNCHNEWHAKNDPDYVPGQPIRGD